MAADSCELRVPYDLWFSVSTAALSSSLAILLPERVSGSPTTEVLRGMAIPSQGILKSVGVHYLGQHGGLGARSLGELCEGWVHLSCLLAPAFPEANLSFSLASL